GESIGLNAKRPVLDAIDIHAESAAANFPNRNLQAEPGFRFREEVDHAAQVGQTTVCRSVHGYVYDAYHVFPGHRKSADQIPLLQTGPISASNPNMNQPRFNASNGTQE